MIVGGGGGVCVGCLGRCRHTHRSDLCVSRGMMLFAGQRHGIAILILLEPKCCRCHQLGCRTEPEEGEMKRILLTAIVLLAAANLPLAARTPSGPVQGAV